jgi:hypothetical protein
MWPLSEIDHPIVLLLATLAAAPILLQYFKWFFRDTLSFLDDAILAGLPDWWTLFTDRYLEGEWAEIKLIYFFIICGGLVASFYKIGTLIFV